MSQTLPSNNDCICHPSAKLPNFGTIYQCNITIWGKSSWIFFFFRYCVCDQWAIWHWHWWKVEPMEHGQDEEGQGMKYLDPKTQPHERKWCPSRPRSPSRPWSTPIPRSDENKVTIFCEVKLLFQLAQDCKLRLIFNSTDGDGLFHQSSSARNELWQPSKILFCKPIALQIVSVLLTLL